MEALKGVKILDFTHVQSGPTCTQLLAWFGADVMKVERPGLRRSSTRGQLVRTCRAPTASISPCSTTTSVRSRSTPRTRTRHAGARAPGEDLRRAGRELRARRARPHGAHLGARVQELNPRMVVASVKGFGPGPYEALQGLRERGAVRRRLGLDHRLPRWPAAGDRRADRRFSGTGLHLALGICRRALPAQPHRPRPAACWHSMQDGVLNLCRVKLRDQQRLDAHGPLKEYTQYGQGIPFGEAVPRAGQRFGRRPARASS